MEIAEIKGKFLPYIKKKKVSILVLDKNYKC